MKPMDYVEGVQWNSPIQKKTVFCRRVNQSLTTSATAS